LRSAKDPEQVLVEHPAKAEREDRRPVKVWATVLISGANSISVTMLDMTYDGCKIATPAALPVGGKLKLSVPKLGILNAEVRWYANEQAGLRFLHSDPNDVAVDRKQERIELSAPVSLRRMGGKHFQTRVFDLSPNGCRIEFVERPRLEEQLWVKLEGMDSIEAVVRWIDGFYGGIEFVQPIHPAVFAMLRDRLK
jgi:PilZ domain-containing protein